MRKGKSLEKLVEIIERTFAKEDSVRIDSPLRLRDSITGKLREHDIVLTITQAHHKTLIAIECRDRSRPVGVSQVESFWTKCQHTSKNQGIIVSSKGFCNTTRIKAGQMGIRCLDLEETDSFNWLSTPGFEIFHRKIIHTNWTVFPSEKLLGQISDFELVDEKGNVASPEALNQNVSRYISKRILPSYSGGHGETSIRFPGKGIFLREKATGKCHPLNYLIAKIKYSVEHKVKAFKKVKYSEKSKNAHITDVAIADFDVAGIQKKVALVYNPDAGGALWLLPPDKTKKKSKKGTRQKARRAGSDR